MDLIFIHYHWMASKALTTVQPEKHPQNQAPHLQALMIFYWLTYFTMHSTDSLQHIFIKTELSSFTMTCMKNSA